MLFDAVTKFVSSCLLAVSAAGWTVDLRQAYEENHTIYLKAGEDLDVLVDGLRGTGYMWMNNLEYAQRKGEDVDGKIAFVKNEKYLDDQLFYDESEDGKQMMMGGQSSSKISF